MNFKCQLDAISQLHSLSITDQHSILIEGPEGCGKSYLVSYYSKLIGCSDIQFVSPSVQSIKDSIDHCALSNNRILLSIENLDTGVLSASYVLLKFLEEPTSNVYVVITCRNLNQIPDTIISRSAVVSVSPPITFDINLYGQSKDADKYNSLSCLDVWNAIKTFKDVDTIYNLSSSNLSYIINTASSLSFKDTVGNIVWKLSHYDDGSDLPVLLMMRYIVSSTHSDHIKRAAIQCIHDLEFSRVGSHAILSKFVFESKYCE